jgi:hypothetical protein
VNRFEYVMVLISIIIGLGITHVLLGMVGILDRRLENTGRIQLSFPHGIWTAFSFVWLVQFWWWEFRFSELDPEWSMTLYLFLVGYAITLFLMAVILIPRSWAGVDDLNDYFMRRRIPFFSVVLLTTGLDVIDALLKGGWSYVAEVLGPWSWSYWILLAVVWQQAQAFSDLAVLGF